MLTSPFTLLPMLAPQCWGTISLAIKLSVISGDTDQLESAVALVSMFLFAFIRTIVICTCDLLISRFSH